MDTAFKIYNASAGSGKTHTLAKEYLKIILSAPKAYQKILAITFTNKAVNEMKERILDSLEDFSKTTSKDQASDLFLEVANDLAVSVIQLQQNAKSTLKEILHNYAFFDISTIDKFTHRLIRTFAKDLKLPQNFEVVIEQDLLLEEAISRLINKAGTDATLTRFLIEFALDKIDDDKSWNLSLDLIDIAKLLLNETQQPHLKKLAPKNIDAFIELQKNILKKITATEQKAISAAESALRLIVESGLATADFPRETLPNHFKKVIDGVFEIHTLYGNKLEANLIEAKIVKKGIALPSEALPIKLLEQYLEVKQHIYQIAFLKNSYANIVPLTLINAIQQEVKAIELERDLLSISKFNTIISNEIKDQPAPFIYERLGEKYRHYFIDEFQDTSVLQWNNLLPLIENALASEGGSLFLVGDVKQAIYRWRGGRAEQFLNLIHQNSNPFNTSPSIYSLPKNYRSYQQIVAFNNAFFAATSPMLNNEAYESLFKDGSSQESVTSKEGLVQLTFLEGENKTALELAYCEEVMRTIRELEEKKYRYQDICIIVRANKEGVLLADYLSQEGIPILSSTSLLLNNNVKVRFLIHLLQLHDQPGDLNLAYEIASFLSLDLEQKHRFIATHLRQLIALLQTEYDFELDRLKTMSVYDGLEYAIKQFNLAPEADAYLNFLLDVVLEVEQKEGEGTPLFLTYWEKKKERLSISAPDKVNAVQIITIHKAKGLEFNIVIYPFANSDIYKEINPKLWLPLDNTEFNAFEEVLITKKKEVSSYSSEAATLFENEQHHLELDAFNNLYVALTRAIKGLYIITKKDLDKGGNHKIKFYSGLFIHYLIEKGLWNIDTPSYTFGHLEPRAEEVLHEEQDAIPFQYSYKNRPSFNILAKAGQLWDTDREEALSKGNRIHYIMGLIETENDLERAFETVTRSGELEAAELDKLKEQISKIIKHPLLSIYYKEGCIVENERDILLENGKILRPDRIVLQDQKATLIDYKSGKKNAKYHEQLYDYADALEAMGYSVENKIIVYINEEITAEFI